MLKFNTFLITLILCVLFAHLVNAQTYPKNGLIFSKEFREGMEMPIIKDDYANLPEGKTWAIYNENKEADPKFRFVPGKNDKEGTALYSRIKEDIGIRTSTKMPKKGTILTTFKVGKMSERNTEGVQYLTFAEIFMPTNVGKTAKSSIRMLYIGSMFLELKLDKNMNIIQEVKYDTIVAKQQYYTYLADLDIKHDEWVTIGITFDIEKEQVTYFANGKKAEFDDVHLIYREGDDPSTISLAKTELGDVSLSDIAIYNRILSEKELLALTSKNSTGFITADKPLLKPHIRMNWTFAYLQLALALLFIIINIFTGRWNFKGLYCFIGAIVAILAVYVRGMLPALPFTGDFIGSLAGDFPVNFPIGFMDQLSYITRYNLPGVLVSLILCISVSFVHDDNDFGIGRRILQLTVPFVAVAVLFFVTKFGIAAVLITLGVFIALAFISSFAGAPLYNVKDSSGRTIDTTWGAETFSGPILLLGAIVVAIIVIFLISGVVIFLFNFWFIFIAIKNYIKDDLD